MNTEEFYKELVNQSKKAEVTNKINVPPNKYSDNEVLPKSEKTSNKRSKSRRRETGNRHIKPTLKLASNSMNDGSDYGNFIVGTSKSFYGGRGESGRSKDRSTNQRNQGARFNKEIGKKKSENVENVTNERREPRIPIVGYHKLKELVDQDVEKLIFFIEDPRSGFTELLSREMSPDLLMMVFTVISKVCGSHFSSSRNQILMKICNSNLLQTLTKFITQMAYDTKTRYDRSKLENFFDELLVFYKTVIETIPFKAYDKGFEQLLKITKLNLSALETELASVKVDESLFDQMDVLIETLQDYNKKEDVKENQHVSRDISSYVLPPPPNNFRELKEYPSKDDILSDVQSYIRPNIVAGSYEDVEHYLDVQFRLLREDFIAPLREGISKYMDACKNLTKRKYRHGSVRFSSDVIFCDVAVNKQVVGYIVKFGINKMWKINWEFSKRFMFGSLLLFTRNNFEDFLLATVADRDIKNLENGLITVSMVGNRSLPREAFGIPFLMAESEVFFEPYLLVMKSLKLLNSDNFPMRRYIVDGFTGVKCPTYLIGQTLTISGHNFLVEGNNWPNANSLGLDDYQYYAFKSALTKKFSVIQGPPGTGKTFIGLKITEVILQKVKSKAIDTPILLVCYTNHALDQFLEGILKFTKKLVRIGNQSRNETLNPYNLRGKRYLEFTKQFDVRRVVKDAWYRCVKLFTELKVKQEDCNQLMNLDGILKVEILHKFMSPAAKSHFRNSKFLVNWLLRCNAGKRVTFSNLDEIWNRCNESSKAVEKRQEIPDITDEIEDDLYGEAYEIDMNLVRGESRVIYEVSVKQLAKSCVRLIEQFEETKREGNDGNRSLNDLAFMINQHNADLLYLKDVLTQYDPSKDYSHREYLTFYNLNEGQRWELYFSWVQSFHKELKEQFGKFEAQYRAVKNQYNDYRQLQDLALLKKMDVVGMTTTGAARLQTLLRELHPRVVIIEEAAEVLESHIVVSLTKECQHVILIGDHKQLRPSNAVYKLAKDYNMNISLFERMVNNGMECPKLNVQHRMRPQIARLICPQIYENLENHQSVYSFPDVLGVTKNVYFIDHDEPEEEVDDTLSKRNIHEANFMIEFCKYLILQGYDGSKITILTTYTGQMMYLRSLKRQSKLLFDVRMIVVDKYQGEENDIILLSLVRSNAESKIGFLKTENRVCVALSRAKYGLYIIGNMNNLTFQENGNLWTNIRNSLEELNAFGRSLTLKCQKHQTETVIEKPTDFEKVPLGGCHLPCNELMECGDHCKMACHRTDPEHKNVRCLEKCRRTCERNHPCKRLCHEKCLPCQVELDQTLPCGHQHKLKCHTDVTTAWCDTIVDTVLPLCGHKAKKQCSENAEDAKCPEMCKDRLPCGHACIKKCHKTDDPDHKKYVCKKPCAKKNKGCTFEDPGHPCKNLCFEKCNECSDQVQKTLPCGHIRTLRCALSVEKIKCMAKCERALSCGHGVCKLDCWKECRCDILVEKNIEGCRHVVLLPCYKEPVRENCVKSCERILPCTHKCMKGCKDPCDRNACSILTSFPKTLACGHRAVIPCNKTLQMGAYEPDDERLLKLCNQPCNAMLKCGDVCSGTCGNCWQGRLHTVCQNVCGNTLICNHSCKYPCRRMCPPCQEKCTYECVHSKCPKKCGEPCVKCKEPCTSKCVHSKCTRKCSDICDREPCCEPCPEKLECGHNCIGFCGEPCPPLCRVCDKEEVTTIVFGNEDEEDARFVMLIDCMHVIESQALEMYFNQADSEIVLKGCPLCKTPVSNTLRFSSYVKRTYKHILMIKRQIYGSEKMLENKKKKLFDQFIQVFPLLEEFKNIGIIDAPTSILLIFNALEEEREIDQGKLHSFDYLLAIVNSTASRLDDISKLSDNTRERIISKFNRLFKRAFDNLWISEQQKEDIALELSRYHRIIDLYTIEGDEKFKYSKNTPNVSPIYKNIKEYLFRITRYTEWGDDRVKRLMIDLRKQVDMSSKVTPEEKRMINEAMKKDFYGGSGHWFTCPNGHYYVITECGGAMEKRSCPMDGCGHEIGGENHRYVETSRLASDMDGASRPAWSSGADMGNYNLNDII